VSRRRLERFVPCGVPLAPTPPGSELPRLRRLWIAHRQPVSAKRRKRVCPCGRVFAGNGCNEFLNELARAPDGTGGVQRLGSFLRLSGNLASPLDPFGGMPSGLKHPRLCPPRAASRGGLSSRYSETHSRSLQSARTGLNGLARKRLESFSASWHVPAYPVHPHAPGRLTAAKHPKTFSGCWIRANDRRVQVFPVRRSREDGFDGFDG